jgi:hypothetical protein
VDALEGASSGCSLRLSLAQSLYFSMDKYTLIIINCK